MAVTLTRVLKRKLKEAGGSMRVKKLLKAAAKESTDKDGEVFKVAFDAALAAATGIVVAEGVAKLEPTTTRASQLLPPPPPAAARPAAATPSLGGIMANPEYPNISLDTYEPDGFVHFFNKEYPGLQCVHWDPSVATTNASMVFIVNEFLSAEECAAAISAHDDPTSWPKSDDRLNGRGTRTSCSIYPDPDSTICGLIHQRVAALVNLPTENLEPTKMTRYLQGEWCACLLTCVRA